MIRQLKAANSELWDIIQDYERKFTLTEEAIENNEAQLRKENRRRADLQRQLDLSIDDKGRTVTVRVHEEETLAQQLEALRHEEHVIKQKCVGITTCAVFALHVRVCPWVQFMFVVIVGALSPCSGFIGTARERKKSTRN